MRYAYLIQQVLAAQPKAILEVGTWNGARALEMLQASPGSKYYGFDLFEDATPETDAAEKNVKPHHTMGQVYQTLTGYDAQLFKGNTRDTLATFAEPVDFVWLDGGHSVETIESDWQNVKRVLAPGALVFFDDYYTGPQIDTERYGCNRVVERLAHHVVPIVDNVAGGGFVQMVRVYV